MRSARQDSFCLMSPPGEGASTNANGDEGYYIRKERSSQDEPSRHSTRYSFRVEKVAPSFSVCDCVLFLFRSSSLFLLPSSSIQSILTPTNLQRTHYLYITTEQLNYQAAASLALEVAMSSPMKLDNVAIPSPIDTENVSMPSQMDEYDITIDAPVDTDNAAMPASMDMDNVAMTSPTKSDGGVSDDDHGYGLSPREAELFGRRDLRYRRHRDFHRMSPIEERSPPRTSGHRRRWRRPDRIGCEELIRRRREGDRFQEYIDRIRMEKDKDEEKCFRQQENRRRIKEERQCAKARREQNRARQSARFQGQNVFEPEFSCRCQPRSQPRHNTRYNNSSTMRYGAFGLRFAPGIDHVAGPILPEETRRRVSRGNTSTDREGHNKETFALQHYEQ